MNVRNQSIFVVIVGLIIAGALIRNRQFNGDTTASYFSTETAGLPESKNSETVIVKNGETFNLTASIVQKKIQGHSVKMLAYNGMIPGPTIAVAQHSQITVHFTNNTDVPTTIHSHGVRLDNAFDGVPDSTQSLVPVGGSFEYTLKFPDAGAYWYHPHFREDYAQELGLYGNFLVAPADTAYWAPVNREVPLFLDDILIEKGSIPPFNTTTASHTLMGRYGNVMLVNGDDAYNLQVKKGEVTRFYITNSANARPLNVAIAGIKMKLVGGDNGAYEKDQWVESVILGPSERAIVEVLFNKPGSYLIQNKTPDFTTQLGSITVLDDVVVQSYASSFATLHTHYEVVKSIDVFRTYFNKQLDKQLKLSIDMMGNMGGGHMMADGTMMGGNMMMGTSKDGIEWENTMQTMGSMGAWKIIDQATGYMNHAINWNFKVGDKIKIRIVNDAHSMHPMQHPIHFHGQRFLVLDRNGVMQTNLVWKDTVLVPSGQYVDILLDVSNPGEWMVHCHIAEHLEDGMMFSFTATK